MEFFESLEPYLFTAKNYSLDAATGFKWRERAKISSRL